MGSQTLSEKPVFKLCSVCPRMVIVWFCHVLKSFFGCQNVEFHCFPWFFASWCRVGSWNFGRVAMLNDWIVSIVFRWLRFSSPEFSQLNLQMQLFPKQHLLVGSWNRRRSPFMRVSSLLMRMLEVTIPKCKVGHKFPGVKFYSHAISAGRSHKKCPEDWQEGRLVFFGRFLASCPSRKQSLLSLMSFHVLFSIFSTLPTIFRFFKYLCRFIHR